MLFGALTQLTLAFSLSSSPATPSADASSLAEPPQPKTRHQRKALAPRARPTSTQDRGVRLREEAKAQREAGPAKAPPLSQQGAQAREQSMIDAQIALLRRLLKATSKEDPEYADLLFRLADLYLEKRRMYEMQVSALYEAIGAEE
jgi:hypothetical protein